MSEYVQHTVKLNSAWRLQLGDFVRFARVTVELCACATVNDKPLTLGYLSGHRMVAIHCRRLIQEYTCSTHQGDEADTR